MDYIEWMNRTGRGTQKKRSVYLKAVDDAFLAVGDVRQERNATRLTTLRTALNMWKARKGRNWRKSRRNYDGAIEELDALLSLDGRMAQAAAARARMLELQQIMTSLSVNDEVKQTFGNNDADFPNQVFEWDVRFNLKKQGPVIVCTVNIAAVLNDQTNPAGGAVVSAEEREAFRTHIQSSWNCATVIAREHNAERLYDLIFQINWVDAASPVPKYTINVDKLHAGANYRDNMLNWLFGNREACIHEFGHMIGNPDEYNTIAIEGCHTTIVDPAIYNARGWTTNSIMNNPGPQGRIHDRHFNFVGHHIGRLLGVPVQVRIMDRLTRQAQLAAGPDPLRMARRIDRPVVATQRPARIPAEWRHGRRF